MKTLLSSRDNRGTLYPYLFAAFCLLMPHFSAAGQVPTLEECLQRELQTAADTMTIGELRALCSRLENPVPLTEADTETPVVTERLDEERRIALRPFTIMAHRPNYILLGAYNINGYDGEYFQEQYESDDVTADDVEAQFQISLKVPLLVGMFDDTFDIFAAYTNRSFWQVYNKDLSSPFRETNHEPEAWIQFHPTWEILGFRNSWNSFGINHQSNGRGGDLSRSWNRVFAWITFERGDFAFSVKPWLRLEEDEDDDDNPNITDYMGHGELSFVYKWDDHVFSIMTRNNLESGFSRGAVQFSWSFPFWNWKSLKGYVQYFNGYGESLIDYNQHTNRVGIGVALNDWL